MVALRAPAAAGANRIVKLELAPGGIGVVGCAVTVKSLACGPVTATFGVPLRLTAAVPTFAMVNMRTTPLPPKTDWPKSVLPLMVSLPVAGGGDVVDGSN